MKSILLSLIKINANYYSFISGVFIALSINLYTNIFSGEQIPTRWKIILVSSILTFISSVCWIYLSWKIDPIPKLAISESPKEIQPEQTYKALLAGKEFLLATYFF